jgi:hypothetical protein
MFGCAAGGAGAGLGGDAATGAVVAVVVGALADGPTVAADPATGFVAALAGAAEVCAEPAAAAGALGGPPGGGGEACEIGARAAVAARVGA